MGDPYRQAGERAPLSNSERRWFTRKGDVDKGPYDPDVLVRSIKSGLLQQTSLVRAEDETEWRPIHDVPVIVALLQLPVVAQADAQAHGAASSAEMSSSEIAGVLGVRAPNEPGTLEVLSDVSDVLDLID